MKSQQDENYHQTHDLALSAALATLGYTVENVTKDARGRATFYFKKTTRLEKSISDYWGDNLAVSPRSYFDALKHLKTRIYSVI